MPVHVLHVMSCPNKQLDSPTHIIVLVNIMAHIPEIWLCLDMKDIPSGTANQAL